MRISREWATFGFSPYKEKSVSLTAQQQQVVDESLPYYEAMAEQAIVVD